MSIQSAGAEPSSPMTLKGRGCMTYTSPGAGNKAVCIRNPKVVGTLIVIERADTERENT